MTELHVKQGPWRLVLLTFAIVLVLSQPCISTPSAALSSPQGNFACPDGWVNHEGACLRVSDSQATQYTATSVCNAQGGFLANIFSISRNQFIAGLVSNVATPIWIGLKRGFDRHYYNYDPNYFWRGAEGKNHVMTLALWSSNPSTSQTYGELCVTMKADGLWYGDLSCSDSHRYVCEKKPDCARGWTGMTCSKVCHCASFECGSSYSSCPYGCQPGWTGSRCDQEIEKPAVVYYCENATDTGPQLVLRVDVKGVNYLDFRSLDEDGVVESNCSKSSFILTSNPTAYSLTVPAPYSPVCPGHLEPNTTSTYWWTFRLAEFKGVLSQRDFDFTVTCDFSKADTRQSTAQFWIDSVPSSQAEPVSQTHEEVKLLVVDPDTTTDLQPLSSAVIGTRVRLAMTLNLHPGIRVKGISPRECFASSADGSEERSITDSTGCASSESPISKLTGNGTLQQTEVFSIFTFHQSQHLLFTCSFEFCFSDEDSKCKDRCTALQRSNGRDQLGYRGKRSAPETGNHLVSAVIKVLPRELPRDEAMGEGFVSRLAAPGMVVAAVAVVALVVVVLSVVIARARSALSGAKRHEYTRVLPSPEAI